jgi:hypothetical protein
LFNSIQKISLNSVKKASRPTYSKNLSLFYSIDPNYNNLFFFLPPIFNFYTTISPIPATNKVEIGQTFFLTVSVKLFLQPFSQFNPKSTNQTANFPGPNFFTPSPVPSTSPKSHSNYTDDSWKWVITHPFTAFPRKSILPPRDLQTFFILKVYKNRTKIYAQQHQPHTHTTSTHPNLNLLSFNCSSIYKVRETRVETFY